MDWQLTFDASLSAITSNYLSMKALIEKKALSEDEITCVANALMAQIKTLLTISSRDRDMPNYLTKENKKTIMNILHLIKPYATESINEDTLSI